MQYELIAPCHFGLEAVLKKEITDLGYQITQVEDGRVTYVGDKNAISRSNMFLRTAERVLLKVAGFNVYSFDELFETIKNINWEDYLPPDAKVWVTKASSIDSKLRSTVDIQSIVKKAIVERLKSAYHMEVVAETGAEYPIRIFLRKDKMTVGLDTSGEPLHKRGYRELTAKAPISETLAAALVMLTPWKADRILLDPFCGSGTFLIEAAMIASKTAPGMNRSFQAEKWSNLLSRRSWYDAVNEANDLQDLTIKTQIYGTDIDAKVLRIARENTKQAGVDHMIKLAKRPVCEMHHSGSHGFIITNPPYGVRLEELEALPTLYGEFARQFATLDEWSCYVITPFEKIEEVMGRPADKKRKLYNGMIKTYYYAFMGPKPPKSDDKGKKVE